MMKLLYDTGSIVPPPEVLDATSHDTPSGFRDKKQGLKDWGQNGARIRRMRESAEFAIYTPRSSAGLPVSILSSFSPPPAEVLDDDELDFPFAGPTRFDGLESADRLTCNPRALRDGYLQALGTYLEEIRRACSQNACDYKLVRTSDPLDAVLAQFISNRLEKHRRT
jgi:hypothetical protein